MWRLTPTEGPETSTLAPALASTMLYEVDRSLPLWGLLGLMAMLFALFTVSSYRPS